MCIITGFLSEFIWWDITLVMVKSTFFAYGCWQHNVKVFRICSIISCVLTIVYFVLYAGYMNCISEALAIVVLVYAMIRDAKADKKEASLLAKYNTDKQIENS